MKIRTNFVTFRIDPELPSRLVVIYIDGEPVQDIALPVSVNGKKRCYIDVRRFKGREIAFEAKPFCRLFAGQIDKIPTRDLYDTPDRQLVHFTPPFGQMNDPNGLVFYEGKWHAFFQYYPASPRVSRQDLWIRHEWGHIVSDDLLHWKIMPQALFHSPLGSAWSGSAIIDEKNVSGLKEGDHAPILLFYTVSGDKTFVSENTYHQRLAYSVDGGTEFRLYPRPLVENVALGDAPVYANRDPKVVWCEELSAYLMVFYLGVGSKFIIFRSQNLLNWEEFQRLELEGDAECPDLYPMTASDGRRLWIFSAASHKYAVGEMGENGFCPIGPVRQLYGKSDGYAGQTFSGTDKTVFIDWMRLNYDMGSDFWGGFALPAERRLLRRGDDYLLAEMPVDLAPLRKTSRRAALLTGNYAVEGPLELILEAEADADAYILLDVFGIPLELDMKAGVGRVGTSSAPLFAEDGHIRMTAVYDRQSLETYFHDGESGLTIAEHLRLDDRFLFVECKGARGILTISTLQSCLPFRT